jgi:plasmid maintenance system antidote protein VapI
MNDTLIELIEASGYKKKFIAISIGVTPGHLSNCINGERTLSRKKEQKLKELLSASLKTA